MSGTIPAASKLKKVPVRPQPTWDVVGDEQNAMLAQQAREPLDPSGARGAHAPFGLHRFQDHRRRPVDAARRIFQQ
ncbi:MAG TPA: hypothetical protein VGK45_18775 [Thermoanaerobaculia bacterium]|jgi:hypothetical protein